MMDLWPDDIANGVQRSPVVILREQAMALGQKTHNVVIGDVVQAENVDNSFRYNFYIRAPALGDYRYFLFAIRHGVDLYPLDLTADEEIIHDITRPGPSVAGLPKPPQINQLRIDSEENFVETLRLIFGSSKVRRIVGGILSQVQTASAPS